MDFPRDEFRTLIGPGGHTIKSIQGDTKTKVNIPDASNENQSVVVVGEAGNVARAQSQNHNHLAKRDAAEAAAALERDNSDYDDEY